ncbi:MAG TPA: S41 family peptidase [Bacteroidia bacterium]|jgi:C-terminal processing protease CtpA/Prc|nr:S41 family peptidase [Bacteroidia bacterium]
MKKELTIILLICSITLFGQLPKTLTTTDKIYGLSKFWEEVNYNFIFLDKIGKNKWDSAYKQFIPIVLNTENDYQYFMELQRFCALLKDGHTNIYLPEKKGFEKMNTMFGDYRLFIENINEKAIVVRTNLSKKNEIPVGSEIIEINGLTTENYIKQNIAPYIASSTDYVLKDWSISRLLSGFEGEAYNLKIKKPKGDVISIKLVHSQTKEKEVFPEFDQGGELLDFKWYDNKIAYVSLNSFEDPKIDTLFIQKLPELYNARGLIIDLRYNGGGNTNIGTEIFQYLTNDKLLYGSRSVTRNHLAAYKAWGAGLTAKDTINDKSEDTKKCFLCFNDKYYYNFEYGPDTIKLTAKRIVIPTVILIGHNTASSAEDFLIYADKQKHMIKIGENTFGSTGQPYSFDLVGGAKARICTKKDTYPDGREFVGYGIKPDIEVKPTIDDYLQKKDPVLTKALEYLKTKEK